MSVVSLPSQDYLLRLNSAQRAAASYGARAGDGVLEAGPLLIIAGAGTGKTMTLAHRVAHLLMQGVSPDRILLLTFTRRAAEEMVRRAEGIVRRTLQASDTAVRPVRFPYAGTFHSLANKLLRRYAANLGLDASFSVLDRGDAADLIDVARHELGLSARSRRFPKKDTCLAIYSSRVNTQRSLEDCLQKSFPWCGDWEQELAQLFRRYVDLKQSNQALDYDDLLLYWFHLTSDEELAAEIAAHFDHILVDEYQDTNTLQAGILHALKPEGKGLTVVGDDAQSIYSFRAADIENILSFPDQFIPSAKVITLERNYRSIQPILDTANELIAEGDRHYRKNLYSEKASAQKPRYVTVEDQDAETEYVVETILKNREAGLALKHQAVLFRSGHHSDRLELELVRRNIPYVKYGGLKFLEAAHVKDLLSILKWADNPKNRVAAFRVLQLMPGMGPANAARCFEHLQAASHSFSALTHFRPPASAGEDFPGFVALMSVLADDTAALGNGWHTQLTAARHWYQPQLERIYDSVEQRQADLEQLEQVSGKYASRERFLTELTLDPPSASGDLAADPSLDEDYLILSTVHSAKGQEWSSVFVLNVTDGNFPNEFATGDAGLLEEERRLMYVAMTRAKQDLHLLAPMRFHVTQQHRHGDKHVYGSRSRFVTDRLMQTLDQRFHGSPHSRSGQWSSKSERRIDVAQRLRGMW